MNWSALRRLRRGWIQLSLMSAVAIGLGLVAPAEAATSQSAISATYDLQTGILTVSGDDQDSVITISRDAVGTILVNSGEIKIKGGKPTVASTSRLLVYGKGGNDQLSIDETNGLLPEATLDGGAGNDTLVGGSTADALVGGDGDDVVTPRRGEDLALLGAGDDRVIWNPGDGSDDIEGMADHDVMAFNGSGAGETIDVSANGQRVRFTRDIAGIVMDVDGLEQIDYAALGGADTLNVHDLSGTSLVELNTDLAATLGGTAGDSALDRLNVDGTGGNDSVQILGQAGSSTMEGMHTAVRIWHAEASDSLTVNTFYGDDTVTASTLSADALALKVDSGNGNDTLVGGLGADVLLGGDGADVVTPGRGNDIAFLGAGDDRIIWNPGDGSDVVEGMDGYDRMRFNGSGAGETIDVSANGQRVRFTRDIANMVMDIDGLEQIDHAALGGPDTLTVNDLSGTDLIKLNTDLAGVSGSAGGDGQPDRVIVNGTGGVDAIAIGGSSGAVAVSGLAPVVVITGAEAALDTLIINTLAGSDTVNISGLAPNTIQLTIN